ncbi:Sec-independent protein translocase protein TatB [Campylobacter lanienae]|uniref:Sec-independent protein translocase protein TatB homolog n=1 Tax=Campylobacter lanienae NCTC 13004 TaxID=1031753 RepID=A0A1X9SNI9_9BACT|nr:Sec-independent protein translocase protein TatB [Campylobacter lanienae]ARQ97811.1 twin arginine translocation system, TatB family protein [Campylobacter lanienae NCTC 13004]MDD5786210.1 Sec-independent protein translocase protein TatB [Campylobacter lanienae]
MFGMGISEIIIIAVIAVIVLGPDKLPSAMVNIAKFFKVFKQTINGAKSTFEQEIKIAELKEDAKKYKDSLTTSIDGVRKKLTLEELDELKSSVNSISQTTQKSLADIQNEISNLNPIDKLNAGLDLETQSQDRSQTAKNLSPNPQITNTTPNELSKDQIQKEA